MCFGVLVPLLTGIVNAITDRLVTDILSCRTIDNVNTRRKKVNAVAPSPGQHSLFPDSDIFCIDQSSSLKNVSTFFPYTVHYSPPVIVLALNAMKCVKQLWATNNMLENGFCENVEVIELAILNQGMIKFALNTLKVDVSLLLTNENLMLDKFAEFVFCVKQQRRQLHDARKKNFDKLWGYAFEMNYNV